MISVIIPTYNPDAERLKKTIDGLKDQSLKLTDWELIIIDNNSNQPVQADLSWHPQGKIVKERTSGLTHARIKGFEQAKGTIIIMVDDDNILASDYLENAKQIFNDDPEIGAIGGRSVPFFEVTPPAWINEFRENLALRDLGNESLVTGWNNEYPRFAPIGAGMGIRSITLKNYIKKIKDNTGIITDRKAGSLSSGGDNDIILEILKSGWKIGYYPNLSLQHIIPAERLTVKYLARLLNNINKSWVLLLENHDINPWKKIPAWTVPLRKAKAWLRNKAWKNEVNYIKWQGIAGFFDGLAQISKKDA